MEQIEPIEPNEAGKALAKLIREIEALIALALAVPATTLSVATERGTGHGIGNTQDTQAANTIGDIPSDSSEAGLWCDSGEADGMAGEIEEGGD